MGFGIDLNPIDAGIKVFNAADNLKDKVVETTVNTTSNIISSDAAQLAFTSFTLQGQITRVGLEKGFDLAENVAGKTVDIVDDGLDIAGNIFGKGKDIVESGIDRVSHPGDPNPPAAQGLTFAESKSASELAYKRNDLKAGDVYKFPDGKEWRVAEVKNNSSTGFRAVALQPVDQNDHRTVVAFSGSDDLVDWGNNLGQGAGLPTPQYDEAVAFASKWKAQEGDNVILTGHSLGGGLASYASIQTDLHATAINSAPLALDHLGLNPFDALRITQYYVPGEALSVVNAANPLDIRPGNQIAVQGKNSILDPRSIGSNHSLGSVAPDIPAPTYLRHDN